ncbi:hypothetical protein C8J36_110170 [Rhizobium sp. PP-F2F-G48]|nr:hypothetical protein C8J36_110170 [Rhizobium sp. PP-F2F-G48]
MRIMTVAPERYECHRDFLRQSHSPNTHLDLTKCLSNHGLTMRNSRTPRKTVSYKTLNACRRP